MRKDVIIKNTNKKGVGVFANRDYKKGEVVVCGKLIRKVSKRTNHSFQIGPDFHVQLDKIARSINHSCEPNTGIRNNFYCGYDFVAMRPIIKGEEITWNYATTEYISIAVRVCRCGSKNCIGVVKGFAYLPEDVRKKYMPFIADYLKSIPNPNINKR